MLKNSVEIKLSLVGGKEKRKPEISCKYTSLFFTELKKKPTKQTHNKLVREAK